MSLTSVLTNIKEQVDNKELKKNETDLKQNIWRILDKLSWPDTDVRNEYQLSIGGRPDFALIRPNSQEPLVFIELKTSGLTRLKKSKKQVKGYYFNSAVPLIVLTDVETWIFYYKGKLAFETGFSSQNPRQVAAQLKRFLEQDSIYRGDAYRYAEVELANKNNLAEARKKIPAAWREIIKKSNPLRNKLINGLRIKAGHGLGVKLEDNDVVDFLQSLESKNESKNIGQPRSKSKREQTLIPSSVSPDRKAAAAKAVKYSGILVPGNKKPQSKGLPHELLQAFFTGKNAKHKLTYDDAVRIGIEGGHDVNRVKWQLRHNLLNRDYIRFEEQAQKNKRERKSEESRYSRAGELVIRGESLHYKNPTDAMVIVFKELERREPGFYQRFYNDSRNRNRSNTRRIIAQDARGLYNSDNPRYKKAYKQLGGGWIISTYNSKQTIEKFIKRAADVAGLKFRKDIIVNFDDSLQRQERQVPAPPPSGASGGGRSGELVILGKSFPYKNPTDAMVIVFKELERREPGFCQRFYNDPRNHGRTGRIIAQDARGLYGPAYLGKPYKKIDGNWIVSANDNRPTTIEKIIKEVTEVAGLEFGRDIIINFDD